MGFQRDIVPLAGCRGRAPAGESRGAAPLWQGLGDNVPNVPPGGIKKASAPHKRDEGFYKASPRYHPELPRKSTASQRAQAFSACFMHQEYSPAGPRIRLWRTLFLYFENAICAPAVSGGPVATYARPQGVSACLSGAIPAEPMPSGLAPYSGSLCGVSSGRSPSQSLYMLYAILYPALYYISHFPIRKAISQSFTKRRSKSGQTCAIIHRRSNILQAKVGFTLKINACGPEYYCKMIPEVIK